MRAHSRTLFSIAILLILTIGAHAAPPGLEDPFQPSDFTSAEIRLVQRALTFEGHYDGLWDGEWGPLSQDALDGYAFEEFGPGEEFLNYGTAVLLFDALETMDATGWAEDYFPAYGVSFGVPLAEVSLDPTFTSGLAFAGPNLAVYLERILPERAAAAHGDLAYAAINSPYQVRERDRWVTAAKITGATQYIRSDLTSSGWVTLFIHDESQNSRYISYVSSSYRLGDVTALDAELPGLTNLIVEAAALADQPAGDAPEQGVSQATISTGTGFFISRSIAVTNRHVVNGCGTISTPGGNAFQVIGKDERSDLAVLRYDGEAPSHLSISPDATIPLGEDVAVLGFPLYGVVSTQLTYTTGVISAANGLRDNPETFTMTAPIQPGNSGGPVLNSKGQVVGVSVATASLDLAEAGQFIPQNINFAIKGSTLAHFLEAHGLAYYMTPQKGAQMDGEVPQTVRDAVVPILCAPATQ